MISYKCGLCNADHVGFSSRHLHQRVEEHKRSTIANYGRDEYGKDLETISVNWTV